MAVYDVSVAETVNFTEEVESLRALAPIADTAVGNWVNPAGGDRYPAIAELPPDSATFIKSGAAGGSSNAYVTLIARGRPNIICYELSALGATLDGTVNVYCGAPPGGTLVASYAHTGIRAKKRYRQTLTPQQLALITDPDAVYVEFVRAANVFAVSVAESIALSDPTDGDVPGEEQHDPVWQTLPVIEFVQGVGGRFPLAQFASDPDGDPLTFTHESGSLPAGVTYDPEDSALVCDTRDFGAEVGDPLEVGGFTFGADDMPPSNFTTRRGDNDQNTAVARWHKFDQGANVANFDKYPIEGYDSMGRVFPGYENFTESYWKQAEGANRWDCEIDWPGKHADSPPTLTSGNGCLRFARPAFDYEGTAKFQWFFGEPRDSVKFGPGQKFYLQWRQRYNQDYIDYITLLPDTSEQAGIKQFYILSGLNPSGLADGSTTSANTGEHQGDSMQLVGITYYQHKILQLMGDWTGTRMGNIQDSCAFHATTSNGPEDALQNARPPTRDVTGLSGATCTRNDTIYHPYPSPGYPPGCFGLVADEWMTWKILVDLTDAYREAYNYPPGHPNEGEPTGFYRWANSKVKVWGGREGQPLELIIDWNPNVPGYFPLDAGDRNDLTFGKITLAQHATGKASVDHPPLITWYDELILSTEDIPDPL